MKKQQQQPLPFVDKAIPMVTVDQKSGKYVLTPQAMRFFKAIIGPIAVVSVAGLYRTGKSYLLNRVLLNQGHGFGVGPTVNPCTKGLWCWGNVIKGTSNDGEPINIVVIDTEGIGALDQDQTHDTKIFTLAILASSCFVYNSVGSIDETAIQNLSLVVNLTKHIQLKASEHNQDGEDPDQISTEFPTFYWVVRDFSLQLQDPQGNSISSKEYLERALAPQNGFSDDIEQKNRIRRLLTAFFKDRDCFTMIRPLVDETKLQNLDKMDMKELRVEFVEQTKAFKKRIVSAIKPKTLKNQKLNGQLYCSMMNSYVTAINQGAVPNIENAWNYMCEQQCRRTIQDCYATFILYLQNNMKELPNPEDQFARCVTAAQEKALDLYRENAIGPHVANGLLQLKTQIRNQIDEMREKNIKQSHQALREYIFKNAAIITKKLNSQQYTSYSEYEREVTQLGQKFLKEGPKYHNYKFVYLEAVRKLSAQGAEFLFKSFSKQQEKTAEMFKEKEKQMAGEIQTLRTQCESLRKRYNQFVTDTDQRILDLTNRQESLQKQLNMTIEAKREEQTKLQRYFGSKESEYKANMRAMEERVAEMTTKLDQSMKQFHLEQQGWLKEKAVFEQQEKFQKLQIEELQKKERSLDAAINLSKTNMSKEVREITMRLETERDRMKSDLENKTEKLNELTEELNNLKQELAEKSDKFDKKEKKYKEDLANSKRDYEKTKRDLENEKKQLQEELRTQESRLREEFETTSFKMNEAERALKEMTENYRSTKTNMEKQELLMKQEMDFLKQENDNLRSKAQQLKQSHEMALASYQAALNQESQESMGKRIIEMKNEHASEIEQLNQTFQSEKKRMANELNNLRNSYNLLQVKYNGLRTEREINEKNLKENIEQLRTTISNITADKIRIEADLNNEMASKQQKFQEEKEALQREFDEFKASSEAKIDEITRAKQYEIERMKMQLSEDAATAKRRQKEEKQKLEKKYREEIEENQEMFNQERTELTAQVEQLAEALKNTEEHMANMAKDYQVINERLTKDKEDLIKECRSLKETLEKTELDFKVKEEEFTKKAAAVQTKLEERIEQLSQEVREKTQEYMTTKFQSEKLKENLTKLQNHFAAEQSRFKIQKQHFQTAIKNMNGKIKQISDEAMQKYSNLSKQYALLDQKFKFEVSRVQQLEKQQQTTNQTNKAIFQNMKNQKETIINAMTTKHNAEKAQIDNKYQQLKAANKQLEANYRRSSSDLEKATAVYQEKISNLQGKLLESETSRASQTANLKAELAKTKQALANKEKDSKDMINQLTNKINSLENDLIEAKSTLDKERSLAAQSTSMLNKIKDQTKRQAEERIKTLEMQLAREHNSRMADKNALDSNHTRTLTDFDTRFRQKTQELNDTISKTRHELELVTREKDAIIKDLTEKYETEKASRAANTTNYERRIVDLNNTIKMQADDLERVRKNKEMKQNQSMKKQLEEINTLKRKLQAKEAQVKEKEERFRTKIQDMDRENVMFRYERENLEEAMSKLQEERDKLAKQVSKLNMEKQRLKNSKPVSNIKSTSFISTLKTTYEPSKFEKPSVPETNKENTSYQ